MTGPAIIIEPHPLGWRVYTLGAGNTVPPATIVMDGLEEARDTAGIVANYTFSIFDQTVEQS